MENSQLIISDNYQGKDFSFRRLGLGTMRMSTNPTSDRKESIATIHRALDLGISFFDTGDFYGIDGHNEKLLGEALKGQNRDKAFISVKYGTFGNLFSGGNTVDVGPKNVKKYITSTLKNLNLDYIDLYQPARVDIGIPIEETIGALSDLVKDGYIKHIGLSEVDSEILRKANTIHPISLVELEYSITNNSIEKDILPVARELGIGVVAFGLLRLGRLFDTEKDPLTDVMATIAKEKNISIVQLAHAWIYNKGEDIIPLTGARKIVQLEETVEGLTITLTENDITRINEAIKISNIVGPTMSKFTIKNGVVSY
ncbi:aldo/keto reductase [Streptococcus zalophi]|uniref:Aldo/keto reductase n=1 Tax=Streptococcus zalophi TaxID=640031 RepID=A0A934PAG4_9STRE|nr:aldo/keto reductase [Streptococcus zalophi]MBJ8350064.1 aldo/keto reductase [Streptococcus zalophi]MCR8968160.1 aldo/keto reductase [Streptococcus zalophi]